MRNVPDLSGMVTRFEQQKVQAKCHPRSLRRLRLHGAVDRMQDVANGVRIKIGDVCDAALADQLEMGRECVNGAVNAVVASAAEFKEILRRGNRDKKAPVVAQHAATLGGG